MPGDGTIAWRCTNGPLKMNRALCGCTWRWRMNITSAGDTSNALATADRAREIAPEYTRVWLFSAALAMKAGNLDDADRFLQRADAISPTLTSISLGQELLEKRSATRPTR